MIPLLEAADRARAENDLRAELAALKAVARLDPARAPGPANARGSWPERSRIGSSRDAVAGGFRAVEGRDLAAASQALGKGPESCSRAGRRSPLLEREVRRLDSELTLERTPAGRRIVRRERPTRGAGRNASFLKAEAVDRRQAPRP